jgi:predicted MPP superfamily phosphohydrolase
MLPRLLPWLLWLALAIGFIAWSALRTFHIGRMVLPRAEAAAIAIAIVVVGSLLLAWAWLLGFTIAKRAGWTAARSWVEVGWVRAVLVALFALAVALYHYGRHLEPRWLATRTIELGAPASERVRLVVISDLHAESWRAPWSRLAERVNAAAPDAVVFLGDSLNRREGLATFRRALAAIRAPHKLAVRGNWDVWYWSDLDLLAGTGFRWLDDERVSLELRGQRVELTGLAYADERDGAAGQRLLAAAPRASWRVLLYHTPDLVYDVPAADLYLAGHTHGGQIAIPFYGAFVTLSRFGKRFERGLRRAGPTQIYVHPGIGVEPIIPFRLGVRPEVTLFLLGELPARERH